jgi:hypothetical protein
MLFTIAKDRRAGFSIIAIGFILSGDSAVSHVQPMKTNPAATPWRDVVARNVLTRNAHRQMPGK